MALEKKKLLEMKEEIKEREGLPVNWDTNYKFSKMQLWSLGRQVVFGPKIVDFFMN